MKILQVHNKYIKRGGEESVIEEERRVLEKNGHTVIQFIKDSKEIEGFTKLKLAGLLLSQRRSNNIKNELEQLIIAEQPDICHVHNVYPLITPVVYEVCHNKALPVVQTLHNYKMICTNSLLFRDGEVCELCVSKSLYNSIKYKCYKNSYLATTVQADAIQFHRKNDTWGKFISKYVCLTDFQKEKLVEGGLDPNKIIVKPNFTEKTDLVVNQEDYFLFVGRLDRPKGLDYLIGLFEINSTSNFKLIGDSDDSSIFSKYKNVEFLGSMERYKVHEHMSKCKAVIFPSKYYEGMPMVILEAFALGKPVIAHDIGAMSSMVKQNINGLKFDSVSEFNNAIKRLETDQDFYEQLCIESQKDYVENYTPEKGYQNLLTLYQDVLNMES